MLGHTFRRAVLPVRISLSAAAGKIFHSSFRPVGAPFRGITGRRPRSGRLGQNKKEPGAAYTVPGSFSAAINRRAIDKREHVLGDQNFKVRHF